MNDTWHRIMSLVRLLAITLMMVATVITAPLGASASAPAGSVPALQDSEDEEEDAAEEEETPDDEDEDAAADDEGEATDDVEIEPEWEDAGVVSMTEYESPQFGYTVEWDEPLMLDTESEGGPAGSETESTNDSTATDFVWIWTEDPISYAAVYGYSFEEYGYEDEDEAIEDWVSFWTSADYLGQEDVFSADAEIILEDTGSSTGGVVIYDIDDDGNSYIRYKEILVSADGEAVIALDFSAFTSDLEDTLGVVQEELLLDGDTVFTTFSVDDVIAAVEELDAGDTTGDDEEDAEEEETTDEEAPADDDEDAADDGESDSEDNEESALLRNVRL